MNTEALDQFFVRFADVLEDIKPDALTADTPYKELNGWASITTLSVIVMVDEFYGVQLGAKDFNDCNTLGELYDRVINMGD